MEDYTWITTTPMATNTDTMENFLDNHFYERFSEKAQVLEDNESYIEVEDNGKRYGVHASGNGDFCNHRIRIEELT